MQFEFGFDAHKCSIENCLKTAMFHQYGVKMMSNGTCTRVI